MSWPCPDCGEPFIPNHMCAKLRENLQQPNAQKSWCWLARAMMLEARGMQMAFQVEQSLRVNSRGGCGHGLEQPLRCPECSLTLHVCKDCFRTHLRSHPLLHLKARLLGRRS